MKNTITLRHASAAYLAAVTTYACGDGPVMQAWNYALHMVASGAAGGAACWHMLERQARLDTRVRMS